MLSDRLSPFISASSYVFSTCACFTVLFIVLAQQAVATDVPEEVASPMVVDHDRVPSLGVRLKIKGDSIRLLRSHSKMRLRDFVLDQNLSVVMDLAQDSTFFQNTKFVVHTAEGDSLAQPPQLTVLRGSVSGDADSRVILVLSPHGVSGKIEYNHSTYVLSSDWKFNGQATASSARIVRLSKDQPRPAKPLCAGPVRIQQQAALWQGKESAAADVPCPVTDPNCFIVVDVALEGDFSFYQTVGSNEEVALAYMTSLLAQVGEIYEREIGVRLWLVRCRVWTVPDPLGDSSTDPKAELDGFRDWWQGGGSGGLLCHHKLKITGFLPDAGGIAYLECDAFNLCANGSAGNFAVIEADNNLDSWEVQAFAHELGHNCGSEHTHCYDPPLDHCYNSEEDSCHTCYSGPVEQTVGTIMSYCATADLTFGPTVADYLKTRKRIFVNLIAESAGCRIALLRDPSYVDFRNDTTIENGSLQSPWNTVEEGVRGVLSGGRVEIKAGSYPELLTIRNSATLESSPTGSLTTVTIGQ